MSEESKSRLLNPYKVVERSTSVSGLKDPDEFYGSNDLNSGSGSGCKQVGRALYPTTTEAEALANVMIFHNKNQYPDQICHDHSNDELDEFASTSLHPLNAAEGVQSKLKRENTHVKFTCTPSPKAINADRYVYWESLGSTRAVGDRVIRTYEDITLTDTSRYVLS